MWGVVGGRMERTVRGIHGAAMAAHSAQAHIITWQLHSQVRRLCQNFIYLNALGFTVLMFEMSC